MDKSYIFPEKGSNYLLKEFQMKKHIRFKEKLRSFNSKFKEECGVLELVIQKTHLL